jgi:hypothetical protein
MRKQFLEPYRTLIGHLRHEVDTIFWDRLIYSNKKGVKRVSSHFEMNEQTMRFFAKLL